LEESGGPTATEVPASLLIAGSHSVWDHQNSAGFRAARALSVFDGSGADSQHPDICSKGTVTLAVMREMKKPNCQRARHMFGVISLVEKN